VSLRNFVSFSSLSVYLPSLSLYTILYQIPTVGPAKATIQVSVT